jgi:hypothetical protein
MAVYRHLSGLGGTAGDGSGYKSRISSLERVYYIDSNTGRDKAGAGLSRKDPMASLYYAVNSLASTAGATFVLMSGHDETVLSGQISLTFAMVIGEGTGSSMPTIRPSGLVVSGYMIVATSVHFSGIRFAQALNPGSSTYKVTAFNKLVSFENCIFEQGDNDAGRSIGGLGVLVMNNYVDALFSNCSFVNTTASSTNAAGPAIWAPNGDANTLDIRNCTFDGGDFGWKASGTFYAAYLGTASTYTRTIRIHETEFINGATARMNTGSMISITLLPSSSPDMVVL